MSTSNNIELFKSNSNQIFGPGDYAWAWGDDFIGTGAMPLGTGVSTGTGTNIIQNFWALPINLPPNQGLKIMISYKCLKCKKFCKSTHSC